jgi:urease accessory protein
MIVAEPIVASRWRAALALEYERRGARTALASRRHDGPLVAQKPLYPEGGEVCHTIVVHPPGGIAGGDELAIAARVGEGAHALFTTPGATRWYKANGLGARQRLRLEVADGGCVEWLPQENLLFDAARATLETHIVLADGARYIGWEIACFGRLASGERFASGSLRQATTIRIGGRLAWNERAVLDAGDRLFGSPVGLAGRTVAGTLVVAGAGILLDAVDRCRALAHAIATCDRAGVSAPGRVFVARYLGASAERCRTLFAELWSVLRPAALGRAACAPRIWRT